MKDSNMILLLQLIHASGNISSLLNRGLQFSQIAELLLEAEAKGYAIHENDEYRLSEIGIHKMKMDLSTKKSRGDGGWISPLEEFRVDKWKVDQIYLPNVEDSFFEP
jgi:hypothetical protein